VPGHIEKMHNKALPGSADVVMLDLEDSVPLNAKSEAREQVVRTLLDQKPGERAIAFRMNGIDSPMGYRDLLEVVPQAGDRIDTIVVPKVNHPGDIHFVDRLLTGIELDKNISIPIGIEASIETAEGMEKVSEIAKASKRIRTLVFGIADYSASVGARIVSISGHGENEEEIYPGHRWNFALSRMVMAAKANGVMAIDAPYGNFKDPDGLARSAGMACALGCDGKWAIHPDQIETINEIFSPNEEDIRRAKKVLNADEAARKDGRGAVAVDGRMVDQATVNLARQLWKQAEKLGLVE
jgi:citrate lyase subunit beta/citryl-CoA lyase/malyl-CoA/(S)-citramalyl-CoA lyase